MYISRITNPSNSLSKHLSTTVTILNESNCFFTREIITRTISFLATSLFSAIDAVYHSTAALFTISLATLRIADITPFPIGNADYKTATRQHLFQAAKFALGSCYGSLFGVISPRRCADFFAAPPRIVSFPKKNHDTLPLSCACDVKIPLIQETLNLLTGEAEEIKKALATQTLLLETLRNQMAAEKKTIDRDTSQTTRVDSSVQTTPEDSSTSSLQQAENNHSSESAHTALPDHKKQIPSTLTHSFEGNDGDSLSTETSTLTEHTHTNSIPTTPSTPRSSTTTTSSPSDNSPLFEREKSCRILKQLENSLLLKEN